MSSIQIVYPGEKYFASFHETLSKVASERVYLEMIEPPPLEKVAEFQAELIGMNGPVYYALDGDRVVGWCDVFPKENPRQAHRGSLGMGILPGYRGKGIGRRLLSAVLDHAKKFGLEKVELTVYHTNTDAIALYEKLGFEHEGVVRKYRKLDGRDYDGVIMGKFL